jgi:hypothetical protein
MATHGLQAPGPFDNLARARDRKTRSMDRAAWRSFGPMVLSVRPALVAGLVALLMALGHCPTAPAAAPVSASGSDQPAGKNCVAAEEALAHVSGDSGEAAPPKFTAAFYARVFTLDVSLDGADGKELPISIEEVCSVPKALKRQAAQLAGNDGVALLLQRTAIWEGKTLLTGEAAATALDGADTAELRVRLVRPRKWREDEDGNPVPTFRTRRIQITD